MKPTMIFLSNCLFIAITPVVLPILFMRRWVQVRGKCMTTDSAWAKFWEEW